MARSKAPAGTAPILREVGRNGKVTATEGSDPRATRKFERCMALVEAGWLTVGTERRVTHPSGMGTYRVVTFYLRRDDSVSAV